MPTPHQLSKYQTHPVNKSKQASIGYIGGLLFCASLAGKDDLDALVRANYDAKNDKTNYLCKTSIEEAFKRTEGEFEPPFELLYQLILGALHSTCYLPATKLTTLISAISEGLADAQQEGSLKKPRAIERPLQQLILTLKELNGLNTWQKHAYHSIKRTDREFELRSAGYAPSRPYFKLSAVAGSASNRFNALVSLLDALFPEIEALLSTHKEDIESIAESIVANLAHAMPEAFADAPVLEMISTISPS